MQDYNLDSRPLTMDLFFDFVGLYCSYSLVFYRHGGTIREIRGCSLWELNVICVHIFLLPTELQYNCVQSKGDAYIELEYREQDDCFCMSDVSRVKF